MLDRASFNSRSLILAFSEPPGIDDYVHRGWSLPVDIRSRPERFFEIQCRTNAMDGYFSYSDTIVDCRHLQNRLRLGPDISSE